MEKLINILEEIRPDVDFRDSENLIDAGYLDSFDIASLIENIQEVYGVQIGVDDIVPEKFYSAETIYELISSYQ